MVAFDLIGTLSREIPLDMGLRAHDLRGDQIHWAALMPHSYAQPGIAGRPARSGLGRHRLPEPPPAGRRVRGVVLPRLGSESRPGIAPGLSFKRRTSRALPRAEQRRRLPDQGRSMSAVIRPVLRRTRLIPLGSAVLRVQVVAVAVSRLASKRHALLSACFAPRKWRARHESVGHSDQWEILVEHACR